MASKLFSTSLSGLRAALTMLSSFVHNSEVWVLSDYTELVDGCVCNINQRNSFGESLLHLAAMVTENLLKKGADVNVVGGEFDSALQAALYYNDESVIRLLLDNRADINAQGGKFGSPLQAASFHGHKSAV